MTVETHGNPRCTHCILSEAINAWRGSEGAKALVEEQRRSAPEQAYPYSDDQLLRFALVRGLGILLIDVVQEESDHRIQMEMMNNFTDASIAQQIAASLMGRR